ncbi:MAG: hypothetical protein AB1646_16375 [Thermodesulfobacteriota bacterium]
MNTRWLVLIALLSPVLSGVAAAQVELKVLGNYVSAYRDGSWVPVDVLVTNQGPDIDGSVEVRTIGNTGDPQNPFYRVPADCPKGSRKLFRLYCRLAECIRIEARLYDRGRLVDKIPATRDISPIGANDYLTLVLDEQVGDYGFLTSVLAKPGTKVRLHRENLKTETLAFLPDYPQCYNPYDVIILGNIDPSLIGRRHRALLTQYVRHGGTLVVLSGAQAQNYRRTWAEELAGVEIGPQEMTTGAALASAVFSQDERVGSRVSRQGLRAVLTPHASAVQRLGNELVLATRRPHGRGSVITLAIDSSSQLLQDCAGYKQMWLELFSCRPKGQDLRIELAGSLCGRELYREAGVKIHSKESVLAYLGVYFLIGIVANWLVCNHYKRRELAWVFLVLFSLGFTGFAVLFGPGGLSDTTQLTRLEVLRVPGDGGFAEVHSFVGIVSHRTSRMSARLAGEFPLANEVSTVAPMMGAFRRPRGPSAIPGGDVREPFHLVEDATAAIDNLMVRARDLRVIGVSGFHGVRGGLEGSLELDGFGLRGFLKNSSGLKIREPFVVFKGRVQKAKHVKGGFEVALTFGDSTAKPKKGSQAGGGRGQPGSPQGQALPASKTLPNISSRFAHALLAQTSLPGKLASPPPTAAYAPYPGGQALDPELGPFIIGWADSPRVGGLSPDHGTVEEKGATLVVFDVRLDDRTSRSAGLSDPRKEGCGKTQWTTGPR